MALPVSLILWLVHKIFQAVHVREVLQYYCLFRSLENNYLKDLQFLELRAGVVFCCPVYKVMDDVQWW